MKTFTLRSILLSSFLLACSKSPAEAPNAPTPVTGGAAATAAPTTTAPPAAENTTPDAVGGAAAKPEPGAAAEKAEAIKEAGGKLVEAAGDKVEEAKALVDDRPPLTPEAFEALIVGLSACQVKGAVIDPECEALKTYREGVRGRTALSAVAGNMRELGKKLIAHESPAVRIKAVDLLGSPVGTSAEAQNLVLEAFPKEANTGVLVAMLRVVANDGARNEKIGQLLISALDHKDLDVRAQAIYALSSSWNKKLAGGAERLAKAAESDPDMQIRKAACEYAGKLGDEKLLPMYHKLTAPDVEPALQSSCMRGLIEMWADYPHFENASEAAYRLTLTLLERTPRTKHMPSWVAISSIGHIGGDSDKVTTWKKRTPWFDAVAVRKALSGVVLDDATDDLAVSQSISVMAALGANAGEIGALEKKLEGSVRLRKNGLVAKAFEKVLGAEQK